MVANFIVTMTQAQALTLFQEKGVTVGPIHDPGQLLDDPHVAGRGAYVRLTDDRGESTVMHAVTPRLQNTPGSIHRRAPALGEHNAELLRELGSLS